MYPMRYSAPLTQQLRAARRGRALSQAALAAASGASRVTIARLEAGAAQDFRLGTLSRICQALGLELAALPPDALRTHERLLARAQLRARRLDSRRRHAVLAARLLQLPARQAGALVRRALDEVERWERERLCSVHYISRWRRKLSGTPKQVAAALVTHDD
jgi:transcriptional regulator with XRE-family HTH domain